ncbi:MAG: RDD family protein [Solirubrobacteraceae bacterium]|nr:RDD family protein [Solirubrobacteraceae bacterium]
MVWLRSAPKLMTTPTTATELPEEAAAPYWQTASLARRFQAGVGDGCLIAIIGIPLSFVLFPALLRTRENGVEPEVACGVWIAATAYLGLLYGRRGARNGQTAPMSNEGIRIVRAAGGLPVGPARAWVRAALMGLIAPFGLPITGFAQLAGWRDADQFDTGSMAIIFLLAIAAIQRSRRTPVDWLCGTAVVNALIVDPTSSTAGKPVRALPIRGLDRRRWAFPVALLALAMLALELALELAASG